VVLAVYFLLPRNLLFRNTWLVIASYTFYGWANWAFVPLLFCSTWLDYWCAGEISDTRSPKKRKTLLWVSIVSNLSLLGYFKYLGLFANTFNALFGAPGMDTLVWINSIVLPLGISFYTFQSMSYTIDVYRRNVLPASNFINFSAYVAMFPQLVAGPIVRYQDVYNALSKRKETLQMFSLGAGFFVLGLAKKVLLANPCGWIADQTFSAEALSILAAWVGLLAYSFQIYFDFSGYSEMAIGLGYMIGFHFPQNFNSPYRSSSITQFWRRWHITLGTWLRDYLYIPLGGSRGSNVKTTFNLMAVMLIAGLWHGAMWTFVVWGGVHGVLLMIERFTGWSRASRSTKWRYPAILFTFLIVSLTWVLFRIDNLPSAVDYYAALINIGTQATPALDLLIYTPSTWIAIGAAALATWATRSSSHFLMDMHWYKALVLVTIFITTLAVLSEQTHNPFIYFRF